MNRTLLLGSVALALAACGPQNEEELITDQEVGEVQSAQSALTEAVATRPSAPPALHLRLSWGYLAGDFRARNWIDWTGGVKVDSGTAQLEHLIFFERKDFPKASDDPTQVLWTSHTRPHFDGVVVKIQPGAATDVVHLTTASFSKDLDLAALTAGIDQRFDVDTQGHQISISSIPNSGCGGFAFGYERPAREGWLGFAGLLTDESGNNQGIVRFRADGEVIKARLIGKDNAVLAEGDGKLVEDKFEFSLGKLGVVKGFYQGPNSFSPRGSFQAELSCP